MSKQYIDYTVYVSSEPGYYGSQCSQEDGQLIAEKISDLIKREFDGVLVEIIGEPKGKSSSTEGPYKEICDEIDEWISENWTAAL